MEFDMVSTLNIFTLLTVLGIAVRELWIVRSRQSGSQQQA
jgi:hypothetical protein